MGDYYMDKLSYEEIIDLASVVFTSDKYSLEEKQDLYLKICEMYNIYS